MKRRFCCTGFMTSMLFSVFASPSLGDEWQFGPDMPLPRNATGAAKDNQGRIYIPGGNWGAGPSGPNVPQASVMRFDETTNEWDLIAELNEARSNSGVARDHLGRIYAIGGHDESWGYLSSVEVYDPTQPELGWRFTEPLPSPRAATHAATDSAGRIYVAGGHDGGGQSFRSVLVFDPEEPEAGWVFHSNMNEPRRSFGFVIDSLDRIYAINGYDGSSHVNSVERYDPEVGMWSYIDSLDSARFVGVGVADCDDYIYAIGGWEPGYTCKVERYNPATELWETFDPINQCRSNIASVLGDSGRLYTFGGDAGFTPQVTVEYYELAECAVEDDSDNDGVPDEEDGCPDSDLTPEIAIDDCDTGVENQMLDDGCTMADLIIRCVDDVVNHGAFVRCVSHLTNLWKCQRSINGGEKGAIMGCAGQSSFP